MRRNLIFILSLFICAFSSLGAKNYDTMSPDGKLKVRFSVDNGTKYEVWYHGKQLVLPLRSDCICLTEDLWAETLPRKPRKDV